MQKFAFFFSALLLGACGTPPGADLVITGNIYTVDTTNPKVTGVAVHNGKIIFVGDSASALAMAGEKTRILRSGKGGVYPGFIEGHAHFMGMGYGEQILDLRPIKSYAEMVERVKQAVAESRPGDWIRGRGWHQDKWTTGDKRIAGFPVHDAISQVSPDNPVVLEHASGHLVLANSKAMQLAGVTPLSKEGNFAGQKMAGGEIIRDSQGNPTGIFNELAAQLIEREIPPPTRETDSLAYMAATELCLRNGITEVHDAGADRKTLELYRDFHTRKLMRTRLYVMIQGADPELVKSYFQQGPIIDSTHWLTIRSVKLYGDGALGSRGAWLLKPYSDQPDIAGMALMSMDSVFALSRAALASGFQVCTHAIGDRTNREVLNAYEQAFKQFPQVKDPRFRIEHAQHIDPADIPRFAALGVLPAMQAIHMSSDRPWAIGRIGQERIDSTAYRWHSLLASGARIINGTDAPVEPVNPLACFFASVTRQTLEGMPPEGYESRERMTRQEALKSYTLDAAFGAFQEKVKGSIEVGKLADFTLLDRDIMAIPESEILQTRVRYTIINGQVLYEAR